MAKFVAIAANYWGSGPTKAAALRELRSAGCSTGAAYFLYEVEGAFEISPVDGTLYVEKDKACTKLGEGKLPKLIRD